jgi:regulator of RNase E activity RraA
MPRRGAGLKAYNMYSEVIPSAKPGDVFVIAGNGANAWAAGENQINHSLQYGIQAWVTDLGMRDVAEIIHMGFPMICKGATPLGGAFEAVAVNVPVYLAGAQIRARDIVVADDDGVSVIPIEAFDKVMTNIRSLAEQEKEQECLIKAKGPMDDLLALLAKKSKPV